MKVLFLCTGNSCRSQMAEGWARKLHPDLIEAYSAGTNPGIVDPRAIKVMAEAGVDISTHRAKHVSEFKDIAFDLVVTVCDKAMPVPHKGNAHQAAKARESCPVWFGKARKLHQSFEDPPFLAKAAKNEEEALAYYRRVRDEIKEFVSGLVKY
ncbi:MAG: arsenate reductase [Elusimicrobia bacterium RIFOXYA12_FULL_51_18]|nr:MAG: arsenate reductase [Elusimicrobia bacterium RIFOXYA12_FULL_51_18]OGS29006.1 MAG: arsenate reductase [Elusimicrobia bacterium RIFOXYA2_FULL_53_38]